MTDVLAKINAACEVARLAFAAGDNVTAIAAITLAAQLVHLAKTSAGRERITCPRCGMTSYHPEDVRQRYCAGCHIFHDDDEALLSIALAGLGRKR